MAEGISKTIDGVKVLDNFTLRVDKGDKIAFVGDDEQAKTTLSWARSSRTKAPISGA